jgi:hypothetical protein
MVTDVYTHIIRRNQIANAQLEEQPKVEEVVEKVEEVVVEEAPKDVDVPKKKLLRRKKR